jgi:hypothetical protein
VYVRVVVCETVYVLFSILNVTTHSCADAR